MRLVLLKSQKFANQPGFYLKDGRWHSIKQDKPVPKGAPQAAHPKAAGHHEPAKHLTDDEWSQLQLPDSNTNAKTFNSQLEKLKQFSEAGDVTAILGMQYGTNTYSKKLAIIANHLLGLHGSEHKVSVGQKAGTHAAVQTAPEIEAEAPEPKPEPKVEVKPEPKPEPKAEEKPAPAPEKKGDAELAVPEFAEGKQAKGVKAHYEKVAKKIIRAAKAGDLSALQFMPKPDQTSWKGKTDNSKKLMALHQEAIAYAQANKPAGKDIEHPDAEKNAAKEAKELAKEQVTPEKKPEPKAAKEPSIKETIASASSLSEAQNAAEQYVSKHSGTAKGKAYDEAISALAENGYSSGLLPDWKKQDHADGKLGDYELKEKDPLLNSLKEAKNATKVAQLINSMLIANGGGDSALDTAIKYLKDSGHGDLVPKYEAMKSSAKGDDSGPKEGETKQGADGTLVFQNGRWHKQGETQKAEQKPAAKEQPKGDAASKLAQIPWDGMLLPDSNKNAKSHNKQIAKIKAMAEAGDIEGLKNFKAGVNTYGKKQNLLAQTALAALEESAPAPKAESKPAPADKPKAETKADDGIPKPPKFGDFNTDLVAKTWVKMAKEGKSAELMASLSKLAENAKKSPKSFQTDDGGKLLDFAKDMAKWSGNNMAAPDDEPASSAPAADGKPQKPTGLTSVHWSSTVDEIETAMQAGNEPYLMNMVQQTAGLQSTEAKAVHDYAVSAAGFVQDQKQDSSASTENDGPMEGETKQGADGMLVFKNGRWHKMGDEKSAEKPAPAGPADVEIPTFDGPNATHNAWLTKAAEALKEKVVADGKDGLKQPLTNHKNGTVTVNIAGVKVGKASVTSSNPAIAKFAQFVDELKASVGKTKKAKPAPKATQAPAPAAEPEQPKPIESMDAWEQTGSQGGSNPGGKFRDENGVEWYCKFPENDHIAKAEVLAAKLYSSLGLNAQDAKLVTKDGKVGIASRWQNVKKASPKELAQTPGVLEGFAADAWLANWDVVGLGFDNLQVDDQGNAMRVDAGGSLMYRAQGSKKAFDQHVTELDSLRDPKINPQAAAVFGQMSEADITASVAKVAQISDAQIRIMVNNFGPGDKAERKALAETLIARKNDLIAKYPKAVKVKKKRLDPTKLPVKEERLPKEHDFANWNGPGAGLSGKAAVNAANQKVESEMLAIAKSGNLIKLKDYKFQPVDVATGEPKGDPIPVGQHPSKHVQQFHQDLIQALDEVANPPQPLKIFQESDLNTLDELDMAFPSKKFGTTVNAVHSNEKMGFWVVLGGVHKAAEKFMPKKITHFTTQAIDAAYQKFKEGSKLAKHFVLSVQASGSYNDLFREGKEMDHAGNKLSDVAKAAAEFATEQPEGTTVYRWQNMSKDMVDKIMGAPDGTVFQATGPMCTSMSPTATSHFGPHRITIHYAKGAKAVESFGSGKFAGEKEVTTLPNSRFVILKKEMVPGGSGQRMELEVLMLPPDLGL